MTSPPIRSSAASITRKQRRKQFVRCGTHRGPHASYAGVGPAGTSDDIDRCWNRRRQQRRRAVFVDRDGTIYKTSKTRAGSITSAWPDKGSLRPASIRDRARERSTATLDGDRLHAFGMNTPTPSIPAGLRRRMAR